MSDALRYHYPELDAGGFTRFDGTIDFYVRVNALVRPDDVILDLGAGRGAASEDANETRRRLVTMKGKGAKLIGVDVDPVVMTNPFLDEAHVYDGAALPLASQSIDLIISDWTFEHIPDAGIFAKEIQRVLKPGGWLCARTPSRFSMLAMASSMIPNRLHTTVLRRAQPDRQAQDVFPTVYALNTPGAIRRHFPAARWKNCTYTWSPEPAYGFNNRFLIGAMRFAEGIKRPVLGADFLHIFLQKI